MLKESGAHVAFYLKVPWALYSGKGGRYIKVTTHLYVVQKLEKSRAIPAQTFMFCCCVWAGYTLFCLY